MSRFLSYKYNRSRRRVSMHMDMVLYIFLPSLQIHIREPPGTKSAYTYVSRYSLALACMALPCPFPLPFCHPYTPFLNSGALYPSIHVIFLSFRFSNIKKERKRKTKKKNSFYIHTPLTYITLHRIHTNIYFAYTCVHLSLSMFRNTTSSSFSPLPFSVKRKDENTSHSQPNLPCQLNFYDHIF